MVFDKPYLLNHQLPLEQSFIQHAQFIADTLGQKTGETPIDSLFLRRSYNYSSR